MDSSSLLDQFEHAVEDVERAQSAKDTTAPLGLGFGCFNAGNIVLWDLRTGTMLREFGYLDERSRNILEHAEEEVELDTAPHLARQNCMDVGWEQRRLLTGADDHCIKLWDFGGKVLKTYHGCLSDVLCLQADWPNNRFITGSLAAYMRVWDISKARAQDNIKCVGPVYCIATGWERSLVLCGAGNTVQLFSISTDASCETPAKPAGRKAKTHEAILTLKGHKAVVNAVAANWATDHGFSGSSDRSVCRWDLQAGTKLNSFAGNGGEILCMALRIGTTDVITGDSKGVINVWNSASGHSVQKFTEHTEGVLSLSCVHKSFMISGSCEGEALVFDFEQGVLLRNLPQISRAGGVWIKSVSAQPPGHDQEFLDTSTRRCSV